MTSTTFSNPLNGLLTGDTAPASGIYRVLHRECGQNEIWIRKGARIPLCPVCGESSAFILDEAVEHISEDADFS